MYLTPKNRERGSQHCNIATLRLHYPISIPHKLILIEFLLSFLDDDVNNDNPYNGQEYNGTSHNTKRYGGEVVKQP
eukprot:m.29211 g.29211  ORF g.29211 m.29211 type:complete len:76 (-) comp6128_c1_seq1:749-976(-)